MEPNEGIKAWQWIATVVVVIILIVLGYYLFKGGSASAPAQTTPVATTPAPSTNGNSLIISDQYPGNIVYVTSATLANGGWVVITSDNNGTPGTILGETYFAAGTNPGKVTLSAATTDGGTYDAVLYSDNGDMNFDPTTDMPLTDSSGMTIMKTFHATTSVTEVKG